MTQELLYTSAERGLKPGSRGFCTVLGTRGMPAPLATALESISGYRHLFPPGGPNADQNPVAFSHLRIVIARKPYHVLSRVADYGLDYSQRSNKLAHHLVLENHERSVQGPAWLLKSSGMMREEWDDEPQLVPEAALPAVQDFRHTRCVNWENVTGDAGWAGVLAEAFLADPQRPAYLIFEPGTDLLSLIVEAIGLLPPERRWEVTFSTYFTALPQNATCLWRCVLKDSAEANSSRRFIHTLRLDLTQKMETAAGGELVTAARTGELKRASSPPQFQESKSGVEFSESRQDTSAYSLQEGGRGGSSKPPRPRAGSRSRQNRKAGRTISKWAVVALVLFVVVGSMATVAFVLNQKKQDETTLAANDTSGKAGGAPAVPAVETTEENADSSADTAKADSGEPIQVINPAPPNETDPETTAKGTGEPAKSNADSTKPAPETVTNSAPAEAKKKPRPPKKKEQRKEPKSPPPEVSYVDLGELKKDKPSTPLLDLKAHGLSGEDVTLRLLKLPMDEKNVEQVAEVWSGPSAEVFSTALQGAETVNLARFSVSADRQRVEIEVLENLASSFNELQEHGLLEIQRGNGESPVYVVLKPLEEEIISPIGPVTETNGLGRDHYSWTVKRKKVPKGSSTNFSSVVLSHSEKSYKFLKVKEKNEYVSNESLAEIHSLSEAIKDVIQNRDIIDLMTEKNRSKKLNLSEEELRIILTLEIPDAEKATIQLETIVLEEAHSVCETICDEISNHLGTVAKGVNEPSPTLYFTEKSISETKTTIENFQKKVDSKKPDSAVSQGKIDNWKMGLKNAEKVLPLLKKTAVAFKKAETELLQYQLVELRAYREIIIPDSQQDSGGAKSEDGEQSGKKLQIDVLVIGEAQ